MLIVESDPSERLTKISEARQLITAQDLVAWTVWQHEQNGSSLPFERQANLLEFYERSIEDGNQPFDGSDIENPAIFAIFDGLKIVASGTVYRSDYYIPERFLPDGHEYGYLDASRTDSDHTNKGFNTLITNARIRWAQEQGLSWVSTNVSSRNLGSIRAKLKAGFILNTNLRALELVYPISEGAKNSLGIQKDQASIIYNSVIYDQDTDLSTMFPVSYGVLDHNIGPVPGQIALRMIPRDFGGPREI
ncbi:MAG: GNAT family N-acetyltransferase [Microgenomates group bacterium]